MHGYRGCMVTGGAGCIVIGDARLKEVLGAWLWGAHDYRNSWLEGVHD